MNEEERKRTEGGERIAERAHEVAVEEGVGPVGTVWLTDLAQPQDKHTLRIEARAGTACEISFSREVLESYPEQVGTEDPELKLRVALADMVE